MEGGGALLICARPAWFCRLHTLLGQQTIHLWQLQVGARSLPFLQHIGDVLSHLELSFARHRALWLGSNKALRHGLIIKRITQVFELSMCLAAVLSSLLGT